jgi:Periplasmic binding protein
VVAALIIGFDRVPLNSVDFSPFAERIANSKADFAYIFIGIGAPGVNYIKALHAQNVLSLDSKTWVIGTGETDDPNLKSFDDSTIGFYSSIPYALGLKNDENLKFLAFHKQKFGEVPGAFTVFAYDGIQVVYRMVEAQIDRQVRFGRRHGRGTRLHMEQSTRIRKDRARHARPHAGPACASGPARRRSSRERAGRHLPADQGSVGRDGHAEVGVCYRFAGTSGPRPRAMPLLNSV